MRYAIAVMWWFIGWQFISFAAIGGVVIGDNMLV